MGKLALWGIRVILGAVMFFASVGPQAVNSNVSEWLERFGLNSLAQTLSGQTVDQTAIISCALLLGLTILVPRIPVAERKVAQVPATPRSSILPFFEDIRPEPAGTAVLVPPGPASDAIKRAFGGAPNPRRDTRIEDALGYIVQGSWKVPIHEALGLSAFGAYGTAVLRFREMAGEGAIRVWGKRNHGGLFELIMPEYWIHHGIDLTATLAKQSRTEDKSVLGTGMKFYDLMVSRAEIEQHWPHEG